MSTSTKAPAIPDEADLAELRGLVRSILEKQAAEGLDVPQTARPFDASLWETLADSGLTLMSTPETAGGTGAGLAEAFTVVSLAAEYAAPVPLAETDLLAAWLLVVAGLEVPVGPLTSGRGDVTVSAGGADTFVASGTLDRVPWARDARAVVVLGAMARDDVVFIVPSDHLEITAGHNLGQEPRDTVRFEVELPRAAVVPVGEEVVAEWWARGALARSAQTCGAVEAALRLTLEHAATRVQFGRPLGRFQAVQHLIAEAAGEATMARAACDAALRTVSSRGVGNPAAVLAVGIAKCQAVRAATVVSRVSHQVHGAIGFTLDHRLRHFTLRMQAWSAEFGDARSWEHRIGALVAGAPDLWAVVTSGDPGRL